MRNRHLIMLTSLAGLLVAGGACSSDNDGTGGSGGDGATTTTTAMGGSGGAGASGGGNPTTTTASGGQGGTGGSAGTQGTCAMPTELTPGGMVSGDTSGGVDNLTASTAGLFGPCQTGMARESVFSFAATEAGYVTFTLSSATDQGIFIRETCDDGDTEIACVDGQEGGMDETAGLFVEANTTYSVVVDGYATGEEGPFTLTASTIGTEAGMCQDGMDNNGDGFLFDCSDPTCLDDAGCLAEQTTVCMTPTALTPGAGQAGDTTSGSSAFPTDPACTALSNGKTVVYGYTPAADELLGLQLTSTTDQGMFVRTDCADVGTQVACRDAVVGDEEEKLVIPVASGAAQSIFVAAYEGGEEGAFTLTATTFAIGEVEPNDASGMATTVAGGEYAHLTTGDDEDWYTFTLAAPSDVTISTADVFTGDCAAGSIDTELELFQDDGTTSIQFNDDIDGPNNNYCSEVTEMALAAGTYRVRIRSSEMFCAACEMAYQVTLAVTPN